MKNKTGLILLHITGCIAFLSLPVLLSPDVSWNFLFIRVLAFQEDFITYTLLLLFFYLNYFSLIPNLYFKQKFIYYIGCIAVCYAIIAWLPHMVVPGNHSSRFQPVPHSEMVHSLQHEQDRSSSLQQPNKGEMFIDMQPPPNKERQAGMRPPPNDGRQPGMHPPPGWNMDTTNHGDINKRPPEMQPSPNRGPGFLFRIPQFEYLFQFMMVLVLSTMIRINNRLKQSEKEKVNAELSYLKAQINPHFLFNTLNSIYASAIDENADNTASAVVMLSGMMRYVISEAHHEFVTLQKEINYINDYIELQKIRMGNTVRLLYGVTGNLAGKQIAPLILISFIENAFKHGVNPEENSSIEIEIDIHDNNLHLSVLNNKVKTVNGDSFKNNIGLENTRNRLQLLYPSRHELVIKDDEKEFLVLLKINLQ